ncbi:expressed unknown protein [Seminavis robusta]|uniref:Uncharacterized protein n=1 Tax=Seminavis robusta TaxID=568900 RepID=A0A9N8DSL1_9STRA|nr:expressed unknown protein [Seminavis robusta]|eukprot:Sro258_g101080.1 n/a (775) ;mRNA; r:28511-30907
MAAILCRGVGQMCEKTCRHAGSLPCCHNNDDEESASSSLVLTKKDSCSYFGRCGNGFCGCGKYLHALKHICTNPFGIFVTVTVVSNIPPMLIALTEVGNLHFEAGQPVCYGTLWLLVNFLFCWVHIIASFYIAVSINHHRSHDNRNKRHHQHQNQNHRSTTISTASLNHSYSYGPDRTIFRRASNLFCYDPVLAVYILTNCVYVGFVFVPKLFHLDDPNFNDNNNGVCSLYIHEKVIATVGFAWAFLGFGLGALALSFGFAYVDATRRSRHEKAAVDSEFATHLSDLDGTEETSVYTSMNMNNLVMMMEGGQHVYGNDTKGSNHTDASPNVSHANKRAGREGPHIVLDEYIPPMIAYDQKDDGAELLSETDQQYRQTDYEQQLKQKRVEETLNKVILSDNEHDTTVADFATDVEETDLEDEDSAGRTKRRRRINNKRTTITYVEEPTTSYEVQEDTESTTEGFGTDIMYASETDRYMDGGETTDAGGPSFETTDIDQAIDLTDNEARAAANLDLVMAVSQDPTISFDPLDTDDESVPGSIAGSIASLVNSITGSIGAGSVGTYSARGSGSIGRNTNGRSRSQSPSKKVITLPIQKNNNGSSNGSSNKKRKDISPSRRVASSLLSNHALADDTDTDKSQAVIDLIDPSFASRHHNAHHPLGMPLGSANKNGTGKNQKKNKNNGNGNRNLEQYYHEASLTYSTSIGTIVGPMEPLSFVDGGGANDGIGITMPPPNIRHLATDLTRGTTNTTKSMLTAKSPQSARKRNNDPPASKSK